MIETHTARDGEREAVPPSPVYKVGVYGATGYTGATLMRLLAAHPNVRIAFATSESAKEGADGVELVPVAEAPLVSADVVFLCLPNGVSGGIAAKAVAAGVRVVDLSADLRLDTAALYTKTYRMEHPAPHLLPAPFGLPELDRTGLPGARYIANPGCHVTATLLALIPLARAGALTGDPIIADTKTGVSGAGKSLKLDSMFVEVYGDVKPYNIGRVHRHVPEIEQALHKLQPDAGPLVFAPHLVPVDVGLLATVYARLRSGWDLARAREAFHAAYDAEPLVNVLPPGRHARFKDVAHHNHGVVGLHEGAGDTIIVTSAIDNLRKGAASQAVQNFNLMMGLPETVGLL
ncbi:MAG: N-acetyl-gamma-glutamyl-phosphate reductase [Anaerolineae bacterium]|nr:N-acetyl-gamma-glutamyl-phosphate reductase [Anaerolineae bacterium]